MIELFLSNIQDIVEKHPEVKPAEAWTMFQQKYLDNAIDGYPEKKNLSRNLVAKNAKLLPVITNKLEQSYRSS